MEYEEEEYDDNEYYDEDIYEDEYEAETYITTRSTPYPTGPVSKNRRPRRSESNREETLRIPINNPDVTMEYVEEPTQPNNVTPTGVKEKKPRKKMLPAPIEQLTEFNVATYLQDLPCGLSVG